MAQFISQENWYHLCAETICFVFVFLFVFIFVFVLIFVFNKVLNNLRTILHLRKFCFYCISFTVQCHFVFLGMTGIPFETQILP